MTNRINPGAQSITKEQESLINERLNNISESFESFVDIAADLGVHSRTVCRIAATQGIANGCVQRINALRVALGKLGESGKTLRQLGEDLDVAYSTVCEHARDLGIKTKRTLANEELSNLDWDSIREKWDTSRGVASTKANQKLHAKLCKHASYSSFRGRKLREDRKAGVHLPTPAKRLRLDDYLKPTRVHL